MLSCLLCMYNVCICFLKSAGTASADHIATEVGIDPKQLDQSFSEELVFRIAKLLPNWMEYAHLLMLTPQEINEIQTDSELTFLLKSVKLLKVWNRKNAYTEWCHYRVLVKASCDLGYANIAGEICKLIKGW